jgi:hypothetical protein
MELNRQSASLMNDEVYDVAKNSVKGKSKEMVISATNASAMTH